MADDAAEVRARVDILEVIGGYVALHRSGRQHLGLCPFHAEKTPSFSVSQEKQAFYCHGCQESGDVISFVEKIEHVDFPRALEILAERAGIELRRDPQGAARGARRRRALELNALAARYFEYVLWNLPAGEPGRRLLGERGVAEALARRFRVGFAPAGGAGGDGLLRYLVAAHGATAGEAVQAGLATRGGRDLFRNRLVFPIADERGQVLGFGGRALGDAVPKYLNTPETELYRKSTALFGLDQARETLRASRVAVVVEGYFDVIAAHAAGVTGAVASSGTALTREQVRILARHADRVVLCFDGDQAGRRAASRAAELCAADSLPARITVMPPGVKDPDEMVRRDPAGFAALVAGAAPEWQVLLDWAMGEVGTAAEDRRLAGDRAVGVLAAIPDPGVREPYVREAMRRLELWEGSDFPAKVAAAVAARSRRPAPPPIDRPAPPREPGGGEEAALSGPPPPSWEEYLGVYAVQQPALARLMIEEMGLALDDLASPAIRRLLGAAAATPAGAGFPLDAVSAADRRLAARLAVREVPELGPAPDPVALQRAISDCVARVRSAARRSREQQEIRELRGVMAAADPAQQELAAVRLRELITERRRS
jgi:DNA primase